MSINERPPDPTEPPSEMFVNAVCHGGTPAIDCQLCGRTHFATHDRGITWQPGELEDLRAKAKEKPDKYIEDSNSDSVFFGAIDGHQVVADCPCNRLRLYEDWIWKHRRVIAEYLRARVAAMRVQVEEEDDVVAGLDFK